MIPPYIIAAAGLSCGLCVALIFYFWALLVFGPLSVMVGP